jgi:hypothetical protein
MGKLAPMITAPSFVGLDHGMKVFGAQVSPYLTKSTSLTIDCSRTFSYFGNIEADNLAGANYQSLHPRSHKLHTTVGLALGLQHFKRS